MRTTASGMEEPGTSSLVQTTWWWSGRASQVVAGGTGVFPPWCSALALLRRRPCRRWPGGRSEIGLPVTVWLQAEQRGGYGIVGKGRDGSQVLGMVIEQGVRVAALFQDSGREPVRSG
jgi:hypothetical protein